MAQVLAVEVMVVLIVAEVMADGASARSVGVYVVSVLIVLLGKTRPRADVFHIYQGRIPFFLMPMMISACGEILGSADGADGARPPLSSTHYGLQRRCGAMNRKAVCKTVTGQAGHRLASCHPPGPQSTE